MIWHVEIRDVRRCNGTLRWTLLASTPDLETLVHADTTERGTLLDLQSDEYVGTSGDEELDHLVAQTIHWAIAARHSLQQFDELDRQRWGRIQQPRDHGRWAA